MKFTLLTQFLVYTSFLKKRYTMFGQTVMFSGCENMCMKMLLIFLCGSCRRIKHNTYGVGNHNHISHQFLPIAVKRNKSNLEEKECSFKCNTITQLIMMSYTRIDLCYGSD